MRGEKCNITKTLKAQFSPQNPSVSGPQFAVFHWILPDFS